jgi:hypothetical protein
LRERDGAGAADAAAGAGDERGAAVEAEAPEPFASRMNGRLKRPLGDLFGLSKALIRRRLDAYAEHSREASSKRTSAHKRDRKSLHQTIRGRAAFD